MRCANKTRVNVFEGGGPPYSAGRLPSTVLGVPARSRASPSRRIAVSFINPGDLSPGLSTVALAKVEALAKED
jgi:hypothetical protein